MVDSLVNRAIMCLKRGGVVVFATDTVWGIGVAAKNNEAIRRLYTIKKREEDKPTAVLVDSIQTGMKLGEFNQVSQELANNYWPGGLTLVVPLKRGAVASFLASKDGNIGLRIPDHELTLEMLSNLGEGVATASANFSGEKAPCRFSEINRRLLAAADFVLWPNGKQSEKVKYEAGGQKPSTVIDATSLPCKILREGPVKIDKAYFIK